MPITKARKDELVSSYVDILNNTSGFVIIQFAGMGTKSVDQLRAKVRAAQGRYVVTKNTLITKALQQSGWPVPDDYLQGPSAIVFGMNNFPEVAKAVLEFVALPENATKVSLKGGVMEKQVLDPASVDAVSKLPSLDEMRAQIAGLIVAPATGLVSVLQAGMSSVVNVLQAYLDDQEKPADESGATDAA